MARGVLTISDLRERCKVDPATHCWIWQGGTTDRGRQPRIWTLDHDRVEKRCMSGPKAAWNIAHGAAPRRGSIVFRCCGRNLCLNPAHLREGSDLAEVGLSIRRSGRRKGTNLESRRANLDKAHAATGCIPVGREIVASIRAADRSITTTSLAQAHGLSISATSRIRRGDSHKHLLDLEAA